MQTKNQGRAAIITACVFAINAACCFAEKEKTTPAAQTLQKKFDGSQKNPINITLNIEDHHLQIAPAVKLNETISINWRIGGINGGSFLGGVPLGDNRPGSLDPSFYTAIAPSFDIKKKPVEMLIAPALGYGILNTAQKLKLPDVPDKNSAFRHFLSGSLYIDAILKPWVFSKKVAVTAGVGSGTWALLPNFKDATQNFVESNLILAAGYKTGAQTMLRAWGQLELLGLEGSAYKNKTPARLPAVTVGFGGASGGADFTYQMSKNKHLQAAAHYNFAYEQYHRYQLGWELDIGPVALWTALRHQQSLNPLFVSVPAGASVQLNVKPLPVLSVGLSGHYSGREAMGETLTPDVALISHLSGITPDELLTINAKKTLIQRQAEQPRLKELGQAYEDYARSPNDTFKESFNEALRRSENINQFAENLKTQTNHLRLNNIAKIIAALKVMSLSQQEHNYTFNEDQVINGSDAIFKRWRRAHLMGGADPMLRCKSSAQMVGKLALAMARQYGIPMTANAMSVVKNNPNSNSGGGHQTAVIWTRETGFIIADFGQVLATGTSDPESLMRLYNEREGAFSIISHVSNSVADGGRHVGYKINNDPAAIAALEALTYYGEKKLETRQLTRHFEDPPSTPDITRQRALDAVSRGLRMTGRNDE